jgi:cation diffusion facilitator CzcD-associated flavoprotein CzcO
MGDIAFQVNGEPLRFSDTVTYQGMMFTAVPNLVSVFGYFRAAWTLRVEMVAEFVCRLLQHMDAVAARKVTVKIPAPYDKLPPLPWSDPENFNPGYLVRGMHLLPKRLDCPDWQHTQDYWSECERFPLIDLTGDVFVYE